MGSGYGQGGTTSLNGTLVERSSTHDVAAVACACTCTRVKCVIRVVCVVCGVCGVWCVVCVVWVPFRFRFVSLARELLCDYCVVSSD